METSTEFQAKYGGGFMGFMRGTQSLANAFWGVGVMPAIILLFAAAAIAGSPHFLELILALTIVTVFVRVFAWYSIFKCRKNTSSEAYTIIALIVVGLDIIHKAVMWSTIFIIGIPKLLAA